MAYSKQADGLWNKYYSDLVEFGKQLPTGPLKVVGGELQVGGEDAEQSDGCECFARVFPLDAVSFDALKALWLGTPLSPDTLINAVVTVGLRAPEATVRGHATHEVHGNPAALLWALACPCELPAVSCEHLNLDLKGTRMLVDQHQGNTDPSLMGQVVLVAREPNYHLLGTAVMAAKAGGPPLWPGVAFVAGHLILPAWVCGAVGQLSPVDNLPPATQKFIDLITKYSAPSTHAARGFMMEL